MSPKRPKHIILVYGDGSYKGYNLKAFLEVCKIKFEEWKDTLDLRL